MERLSNIRIHTLCKVFPLQDTLIITRVGLVNQHIYIYTNDEAHDLGIVAMPNLSSNVPCEKPSDKGCNVASSNVLATLLRGIDGKDGKDGKDGYTQDLSEYYKKTEVDERLDAKQDSLADLETIRSGSSAGATAVQPSQLASVATSGSYNDLKDKPNIPAEVTKQTVVDWGFGTYSKPDNGIPASDLDPNVFLQGEKGDKGDKGDAGVGVRSVVQTTTSNADGGSNVVMVTLTNGAASTFTVKNGSKGSPGEDGDDGENGATFTPSVDSAGNLSWTNDKGLPNPATVNIKGPKGEDGSGGGGEVVIKDNIYVATFSIEDLEALIDDPASVLRIPIDFIRAVVDKKTILIPTGGAYGNGYAVVTDASGYEGAYDAGVAFSVLVGRTTISVDQDNEIVDGALLINHNCISIVAIPDRASVEEIEQAIEDLPAIRNNAAKGATALQYYVTTFDYYMLIAGETLTQEEVNKPILLEAIKAQKLILMPIDNSLEDSGYIVLNCFVDGSFLYINFIYDYAICYIETECGERDYDIYASEIIFTDLSDIDSIREDAAKGATAVQPSQLNKINGQALTGGINIEITGEKELVATSYNAFGSLQPYKIYHITNYVTRDLSISEFVTRRRGCDEYEVHFITGDTAGQILFPTGANIKWANGEVPTLEPNTAYELSVVGGIMIDDTRTYKAVLTPFK